MTESYLIDKIGSNTFWAIMVGALLGSIILSGIWAYKNDSVSVLALVIIFGIMSLTGIILSGFEVFSASSLGVSSISYLSGFSLYLYITTKLSNGTYSVLSVSQNTLLSSIIGQMPRYLDFLMTAILIPIAEELFWMFGVSFLTFSILKNIAKSYKPLNNFWLQLAIVSIISGGTFASFHVGRSSPLFIIGAILFRTSMAVIVFGDIKKNVIPYFTMTTAFALGSHQGNNWGYFGWSTGWSIINENFGSWGWIVYLVAIVLLLSALITITDDIFVKQKGVTKTKGIVIATYFIVIIGLLII